MASGGEQPLCENCTCVWTGPWVTDHIIVPSYRQERGHIFYEALTTLAYVSSIATQVVP